MTSLDGLADRGLALWKSLGCKEDTPEGALALEACRTADRLDELDRVIAGKGVLSLMRFRRVVDGDEPVVVVKFDSALGEARQQQNALRQMLITLGVGVPVAKGEPQVAAKASAVDEFTKRRQERKAK